MKLGIVNESTVVPADAVRAIAAAVTNQLRHDAAPAWNRLAPNVAHYSTLADVPADHYVMAILDDSDQAGALAYHDETPDGRPYSKTFAKTILDNGGTLLDGPLSVSAAFSHEALEIFGDVTCLQWSDRGDGTEIAFEVSDPVQNGAYVIQTVHGPVSVSNFVLPSWFDPRAQGPFDHMGVLTSPLQLDSGGYAIVRNVGREKETFGKKDLEFGDPPPPDWMAPAKLFVAARTARRLD